MVPSQLWPPTRRFARASNGKRKRWRGSITRLKAAPVPPQTEPGFMSLFNGKDLDGWDIKIAGYELNNNFGNTFRVENGIMKTAYDQYGQFNNRLKEEFGGNNVRVRGYEKVKLHLMFGVIALFADQLIKLIE
jgi:hypothetical protein